jgi:hypothetical protein
MTRRSIEENGVSGIQSKEDPNTGKKRNNGLKMKMI